MTEFREFNSVRASSSIARQTPNRSTVKLTLLNSSRLGKSLVKKPSFFLSGFSLKMSLYLLFSKYGCLPSLHLVAG
jgi:hypothetical protein